MLRKIRTRFGIENITIEMALFYLYKIIYQRVLIGEPERQVIMPIFGCQRSGTSMMTRLFFRDVNAKVYRESSKLSSNDIHKLRLNSLDCVRKTILKNKAPLVILKPIVESQNSLRFLRTFPEARALWMFRHYRDVAASSMRAFGNDIGITDLQPIFNKDLDDWRSDGVSDDTYAIIAEHYSEDMNQNDAAALFWYARNALYFEQCLDSNPNVFLCRYEDLTSQPKEMMSRIYDYLGRPYPGDTVIGEVHVDSVGKGQDVAFSPQVEQLCITMLNKLEQIAVH